MAFVLSCAFLSVGKDLTYSSSGRVQVYRLTRLMSLENADRDCVRLFQLARKSSREQALLLMSIADPDSADAQRITRDRRRIIFRCDLQVSRY